jgi:glycosyltransferase involved in cell wall biosynthesis
MMMNQKDNVHILILSHSYPTKYHPFSGIFWKEQAHYFANIGNKVNALAIVPISIKSYFKRRVLKERVPVSHQRIQENVFTFPNIPFLHFMVSYLVLWRGKSLIQSYIHKNGKPDIIHLHRFEAGLLALYIKKRFNIPVVFTEHSSRFLYHQLTLKEQKIAKKVFMGVNYRIAVSPVLCAQLKTDYNIEFHYVPNTVDIEKFKPNNGKSKEESFTFFTAGNLGGNKNHSDLIDAFHTFQIDVPHSQLIIAGVGPLNEFLRAKIKKFELEKKVFLVGQLPLAEMIEWMNKSHVAVVSSKKETFSVVIIEALSCGLPVVSTKCGGPESIITSEYLGELVDITPIGLLNGMKKVHTNYAHYSPQEIVKFVEENYSESVILSRVLDVYRNLL